MPIRNVVVGSSFLWHDTGKVGLHVFTEHLLDKGCRLEWFTVPLSLLHLTKPRIMQVKRRHLRLALTGGERYASGDAGLTNRVPLTLLHPIPQRPFLGGAFVLRNYLRMRWPSLPALARRDGVAPLDLLFFDCGGVDIYQAFAASARRVVYRVSDFVSEFPRQIPERVRLEQEIIRQADVLLLAYETMRDEVIAVRGTDHGVHVLPNGGKIQLFQRPAPPPPEYRDIPAPRAIYVGTMSSWFDWELLLGAARLAKDVSFCLLGRGRVPDDLPPNVFYLGSCHHDEVPGYLQHASVGLIPFVDLPRIRRIDRPLKFYEYLASGLPIVSTPHGHLRQMAPHALFGATAGQFAQAIQDSLGFDAAYKEHLKRLAEPFAWANILKRFDQILEGEGICLA